MNKNNMTEPTGLYFKTKDTLNNINQFINHINNQTNKPDWYLMILLQTALSQLHENKAYDEIIQITDLSLRLERDLSKKK